MLHRLVLILLVQLDWPMRPLLNILWVGLEPGKPIQSSIISHHHQSYIYEVLCKKLSLSHALVPVSSLRSSCVELFVCCYLSVPRLCQRSS